jgi:hypothetical protein
VRMPYQGDVTNVRSLIDFQAIHSGYSARLVRLREPSVAQ